LTGYTIVLQNIVEDMLAKQQKKEKFFLQKSVVDKKILFTFAPTTLV
jgi:hypothetical protein